MEINKLIKEAHANAVDKGFYDCPECGGVSGFPRDKENINRGDKIKERCLNCNGTGIDPNKNIGELLMLIVSEIGEALEAHRKERFSDNSWLERFLKQDKEKEITARMFETKIKDTFQDELADVAIRLFDLCGYMSIDLEKHIESKMQYNKTRPRKHGKKY